jgi:hypothetical protein
LPPRSNWDSECGKWLKGRVRTLPLCESGRDEAAAAISQFLSPRNPYQVCGVWGHASDDQPADAPAFCVYITCHHTTTQPPPHSNPQHCIKLTLLCCAYCLQVMIVSYETFRIHAERFRAEGTCDLLICDEVGGAEHVEQIQGRALAM